ncbi:hypothetical protein QYE76_006805 [Lolium multiflorum]|uniref:Uncharacterized protein n=1 Tax=Lolium multiflorum TaxID=4521 RepID=A0AAD8W238_LOLMU|nr:hypothetical protein QYE76_006805 [Lolium multiflorum]
MDACAYMEEPIVMAFGEFDLASTMKDLSSFGLVEFSMIKAQLLVDDEEFSSTYFVDNKASGKLAKIFNNTSLSHLNGLLYSCAMDAIDFNFIDKSVAIGSSVPVAFGLESIKHILGSAKHEANERADTLAQKLEQCEEARMKAESDAVEARQEADKAKDDAAGVEDLRKHRTSQEFELENPDNDSLLDAVSFLEFHGTEAREGMDEARAGLSKLFPYLKKEEPATFLGLAKCFNPPEDLG